MSKSSLPESPSHPKPALPARRMLFTVGAKGGVGKSFFAKTFLDCLNAEGIPVRAYDCDDSTRSLQRAWPAAKLVPLTDIATREVHQALEGMFEEILASEEPFVICDFRAGSGDQVLPLLDLLLTEAAETFAGAGLGITAAAVFAAEADSLFSVVPWVETLRRRVDWLFVRNAFRGQVDLLESSEEGRGLIELCLPLWVDIPALEPKDAKALRDHNLTLADAVAAKRGGQRIPGVTDLVPSLRLRKYQAALHSGYSALINHLVDPGDS